MVTIVNNCLQFEDLANQTKLHYWKPGIHDIMAGQKFETLRSTFQVIYFVFKNVSSILIFVFKSEFESRSCPVLA